jgi:manganese/iron transport system permease protein
MDNMAVKAAGVMALAGAQCGMIGVFVFLLNIPFIGVAIAHAAMAGGIWAVIFSIPSKAGAFIASIAAAIGAGPASDKFKTGANVTLAVIFALCMGLAFMGASLMPGGMQNATGYLWGSVFLSDTSDIIFMAAALLLTSIFVIIFYRQVSAVLFNRELAAANGINEKIYFYAIMSLSAVVIAVNLNIIGGLMLFALVIIPPAIAAKFSVGLKAFMIISVITGAACGAAGTVISFIFNLPVSATVVLFNCILFFALSLVKR